jgi:hypothetical protein
LDREERLVSGKNPVHTGYEYVQVTDLVWPVVRRKILPCQERTPGYPGCGLVTILTELSRLITVFAEV